MNRALGLICLLAAVACNRHAVVLEKSPTPVRLVPVETYTPGNGQTYSASILPNRQVTLAFRTSGFIESIEQVKAPGGQWRSVDIGGIVTRGTVLARVRAKDYQLQVAQTQGQVQQATQTADAASAQLLQAQAAAAKAKQDFDRADALYKKTSLTKSDYDAAKENLDATQAQVRAAKAQAQASAGTSEAASSALGTADLGLQDTSLKAPFTGVVVQRSVDVGMLAGPGVPAFVIADIATVKAAIAMPDTAVAHLRKGSRLDIFAEPYPGQQFKGFISAIAAAADTNTRSFQVEVTVPNQRALLRPGMVVSLALGNTLPKRPVSVVPLESIVSAGQAASQFAVVVVAGDKARHEPVTLGDTFGDRIAVTGVSPGERVVSSGAGFLSDGDLVKVIP